MSRLEQGSRAASKAGLEEFKENQEKREGGQTSAPTREEVQARLAEEELRKRAPRVFNPRFMTVRPDGTKTHYTGAIDMASEAGPAGGNTPLVIGNPRGGK